MDIGFEILLPIEATMLLDFKQPIYEWDGEIFPQGPEEAWFHYFKLIKSTVPLHIVPLLPGSFENIKWQCISIMDGLDNLMNDLSIDVNNIEEDNFMDEFSIDTNNTKKDGKLLDLLSYLTGNEKNWVIIFEPGYDKIDDVLEGGVDVAFSKIICSLTTERKGFLIWFKNEPKHRGRFNQMGVYAK